MSIGRSVESWAASAGEVGVGAVSCGAFPPGVLGELLPLHAEHVKNPRHTTNALEALTLDAP
jgi:hypothetical protein